MHQVEKGLDGIERLIKKVDAVVKEGKDPHDYFGKDLAENLPQNPF